MSAYQPQPAPPPGCINPSTPLPPPTTPPAPQPPPTPTPGDVEVDPSLASFDRVHVVLALLLAFALGSSPLRNTDVWEDLAAGRDLLHGQYNPFAARDIYSYTGGEWINHSWLYDV